MTFRIFLFLCVFGLDLFAQGGCKVEPYKITITDVHGNPLQNVKVTLVDANNYSDIYYTNENGQVNGGTDGCVRATFEYNDKSAPFSWLSTIDLIIIQRDILSIAQIVNPALRIAADANNDGKITANDLTEFRKLILQISSQLPNNKPSHFAIKESIKLNPIVYSERNAVLLPYIINDNVDVIYLQTGSIN